MFFDNGHESRDSRSMFFDNSRESRDSGSLFFDNGRESRDFASMFFDKGRESRDSSSMFFDNGCESHDSRSMFFQKWRTSDFPIAKKVEVVINFNFNNKKIVIFVGCSWRGCACFICGSCFCDNFGCYELLFEKTAKNQLV